MGRDRLNGGATRGQRRSRPAPRDAQPLPDTLWRNATEVAVLLSVVAYSYRREYELGWPPGGAGLHVQSSPTDATMAALLSPEQTDSRERCRVAAARVNEALVGLRSAARMLTEGEVTQPPRARDAVVSRQEWDSAVTRRGFKTVGAYSQHLDRERELRS